ncbi:HNH endonuclease [Umezawaea sp.]|uniref:HNH endonuclease n=1 Tax=Umezawaea sp. TaxID=1955258 RepID=UPI002ED2FBBF
MTGLALLDDAGLVEALRVGVERARSAHASVLAVLAEARSRGLEARAGYRSLAELVKHVARVDTGEAKRWVAQAAALFPSTTPTGAVVAAPLPVAAVAVAEGALSPAHLDVLVGAMASLPAEAERILVDVARSAEPAGVRAVAAGIRARVDQDGREPDDREPAQPVNLLHLRTKLDGRVEFSGRLGYEQGELLRALIGPLAKPHAPDAAGPDTRTLPERQGDALADVLDLASRSPHLPTEAGERPHVTVTVDHQTLVSGIGTAVLGGSSVISASEARRIACGAGIIPVVLGGEGEVLDIGRMSRRLTPHLRRALHLRDGGCAFPMCDRPPNWADAHHVVEWHRGGPTSIDNLVLLCRRHHTLVHRSEWEVRMESGLPHFIPPAFIDPRRRPLHNAVRRPAA